jgi:hypothetical protein
MFTPRNTRSGPADIGGVVKIMIAICVRLEATCIAGSGHYSRGVRKVPRRIGAPYIDR